ncbi:phosphotransferase system [Segniliparus rotundus DSM 44985]|uniref:Phosphotransferase system n=1 Tax=Segniliparus rotundus (strain ATCC BAA-972 / CDC 1076 / CIP 108378 / DSM 44985 / JCM 13578) TaxID=640132 RepID=D6Z9S7_SEGRD|nr:hypothetical protein [Segniliparus rotundus]ADG98597.1 phosphotransferase system [Segniliparus rotundus DSM 44985]
MSNTAVSTLAMQAAVIGTENLQGLRDSQAKPQPHGSWLSPRAVSARDGLAQAFGRVIPGERSALPERGRRLPRS